MVESTSPKVALRGKERRNEVGFVEGWKLGN